ncbi:hypothetical protein PROFUN_01350 [Planoprotostelium fungivorum]|uniref:Uncharacterized protein n=1 Tax=Planoprotostelium fungivorum TaxID=1890364 RepID=A0A2P6NZX8_9EUKA|nr:hypothetical protein PROFUN_01350 [Planoprotostelium fungivorum]
MLFKLAGILIGNLRRLCVSIICKWSKYRFVRRDTSRTPTCRVGLHLFPIYSKRNHFAAKGGGARQGDYRVRTFLITGRMRWEHSEWTQFNEQLLTWVSQHHPPEDSYATERLSLFEGGEKVPTLPAYYLFRGKFLPSGNSDGLYWKPSRGEVLVGGQLLRRYHYTTLNGVKLRRQVSYLKTDHRWCFVEYTCGSTRVPTCVQSVRNVPQYDLTTLIATVARFLCDPQGCTDLTRAQRLQRMAIAASGGVPPPIEEEFDPFNQPPQIPTVPVRLNSGEILRAELKRSFEEVTLEEEVWSSHQYYANLEEVYRVCIQEDVWMSKKMRV